MKFKKFTLCALMAGCFAFALPATAQNGDYPTNYTEYDYSSNGGRYLRSIKLTPTGETTTTISVSSYTGGKIYNDLTAREVVNVEPGVTIDVVADYVGEWMHAYLYLDHGNDGQFSYNVGTNSAAVGSDLVSFSFYSFGAGTSDYGYNSAGEYLYDNLRSTVALSPIAAPTEPGDYRMRLKIDWDNIDPAGSPKTSSNPLTTNGGAIVDFILHVNGAAAVAANDVTDFAYTVNAEKNVVFTWTNPTQDVNGNELDGVLTVKLLKGDVELHSVEATPGANGEFVYTPETYDNGQEFVVKTVYKELESTGVTTTVNFPAVPKAVTDLQATPNVENKTIDFAWTNPSLDIYDRNLEGALTVKVFCNEEEIASFEGETAGQAASHNVTPKNADGTVVYAVKVFNGAEVSAAETVSVSFPEVPRYPTNYTEEDVSAHAARYLRGVQLTADGAGTTTVNVSSSVGDKIYNDLTASEVVTVEPGATVNVVADYVGEWMHAYLYLDHGNDGQFSYNVGTNSAAVGSDLVSFSFYSFSDYQEDYGYDSKGTFIMGDNRSTVTLPNFTAPAETGDYRMRLKIDWNNIDPAGSPKTSGNSLTTNGGAIVDFILRVKEAEPAPEGVAAKEATGFTSSLRVSNKSLLFSWTNPTEDVENNPLRGDFEARLYKQSSLLQTLTVSAGEESILEYTPTSYFDGEEYTLKIFYGNTESAGVSTTVNFPAVPKPVMNLLATPDVEDKGIYFAWQNPTTDIFGRALSGKLIVKVICNEEVVKEFEEDPDATYARFVEPRTFEGKQNYVVRVYNGTNESEDVSVDVTFPAALPEMVGELKGTFDLNSKLVTLSWVNPTTDVLGRRIEGQVETEIRYNGEELRSIMGSTGDAKSYPHTPTSFNEPAVYEVVTVFDGRASASARVEVSFPEAVAPTEVLNLDGKADGYKDEVSLTWVNPSEDILGRELTDIVLKVYEEDELIETIEGAVPGETGSYTYSPKKFEGVVTFKVTVTGNGIETNGATVALKLEHVVGIENATIEGIRFDAATARLFIVSDEAGIYDLQGRQVALRKAEAGVVDLSDFAKGIYVVRTADANGKMVCFKIAK